MLAEFFILTHLTNFRLCWFNIAPPNHTYTLQSTSKVQQVL